MGLVADNVQQSCGDGDWIFTLYKPERTIGIYSGKLVVSKDFNRIWTFNGTAEDCVISIPSQNVAYVTNQCYVDHDGTLPEADVN